MKAIVWTNYGPPDVLNLQKLEKPTPKDTEVLIRIHAATVTTGDCEMRRLQLPILFRLPLRLYVGVRKPKRITILGQELAGEIEAVGKDVTLFKPRDPVFAATGFRFSAYAEYVCLSEDACIAIKPANMTYAQAAAVPVGGLEALHFFGNGAIRNGQKVLIYGAGGSIGTVAIQLAKAFGAQVTAVDRTGKLDMLRALGADKVIDYTQPDFATNGETYDVIFDVVGKSSFSKSVKALKENGRYLLGNPGLVQMARAKVTPRANGKQVIFGTGSQKKQDLVFLRERIEAGKVKAIIDKSYPLEQTAEAHRYVETGQKKGNVVITVA